MMDGRLTKICVFSLMILGVCVLTHSVACEPMDCIPLGSSVMGFPRQEYWKGLPYPPLIFLTQTQGLNSHLLQ